MRRAAQLIGDVGREWLRNLPGVILRSRRVRITALVLVAAGAAAPGGRAGSGGGAPARELSRAAHSTGVFAPGDTVAVWGPLQFNGSNGQGQTYVEAFTVSVQQGRQYVLHLFNGAPDGTHRASKVTIKLNGFEIVSQNEVTQQVAQLDRPLAVTASDTIQIKVAGSGSPFITLSVLSIVEPTFNVFGPNQYAVASGTSSTYGGGFNNPGTAAPPYRMFVYNGASDGALRVNSASIQLNGSFVVSTSELTSSVGSLSKPVTLTASNLFVITVNGPVGRYITVVITASDTAAPVLTITTPLPGAAVATASVLVSGTVLDQTPTTVTVNGTAAAIAGTSYSATVPLPTEGSNLLTVRATDATGRRTDSTRTVIRDTQAPLLTVTTPADGSQTAASTIAVTGTAQDATAVTVNVNGTVLPGDVGGGFSGSVPLTEGTNLLTITATDAAQNAATVVRTVLRDTEPPVLTVSAPAEGTETAAATIGVSGTATDATAVTVTINGTGVPLAGDESFSGSAALVEGPNTIMVVATDALNHTTTVIRSVTRTGSALPPDPATVAPLIDRTVATTTASATAFLYTGSNPIQTGVSPGTIDTVRAALLRGRVLDRAGQPLSGASISIVGHPELGQTLSRADGRFDLAVNGGLILTVNYAKSGFLPSQRQIDVPWQDYRSLPDVVLVPLDPVVTTIDFSEPIEVARGTVSTDADGSRRATVLFEQGTTATMVLPNGSTQPLPTMHVRATEFTVGENGPQAMPGDLPPSSAYTYAVELSADEAVAASATEVRFSKPAVLYVENFLDFPVGGGVPVGYYDRKRALWVASANGRIVEILGVTAGKADLDVAGNGSPAGQPTLDSLGISDAERTQLATLYPVGQSLWRTRHTHFTPIDANWIWGWTKLAKEPPLPDLAKPRVPCPNQVANSIIECENQVLGERLEIVGTPYSLNYRSSRTPGDSVERTVVIPLSPEPIPDVRRIDLRIEVAGQVIERSFPPVLGTKASFTWDGRDAYGRLLQGAQQITVRVGYAYDIVSYLAPGVSDIDWYFGRVPRDQILLSPRRIGEQMLWSERRGTIGGMDAALVGLGSWTLSAHHAYDPNARVLFRGDGGRQGAEDVSHIITTVAGNGVEQSTGDSGPATAAGLDVPVNVAAGPDGAFYLLEWNIGRLRRVRRDGIITTIAGGGDDFFTDSIPATEADIGGGLFGLALEPDGSIIIGNEYDGTHIGRLRRVTPEGLITTIIKPSLQCSSADPVAASEAGVGVFDVAVASDGAIWIADGICGYVRRVGPNGIMTTEAGNGNLDDASGDGGPASQASVATPWSIAIGPDGSVFFADYWNSRVRRIGPDGIINTVVGTGVSGVSGDGGPGSAAQLRCPNGLAFGPDGSLYISDECNPRIRRVDPDGIITSIAGNGQFTTAGDGGPASGGSIDKVQALDIGPDGSIYGADTDANRVRAVKPAAFPGVGSGSIVVASGEGSEVYEFSSVGRHLRTLDALTGATLLTFEYGGGGRLESVTDADDNVTSIERGGDGTPTAIVAPFGQRTEIQLDAHGYLARVENPAGEVFRPGPSMLGLLDSLVDFRGLVHRFEYDSLGRLSRDENAGGGFFAMSRVDSDSGHTVTMTSSPGRERKYTYERTGKGDSRRITRDPAGFTTTTLVGESGTTQTTVPDGTQLTVVESGSPQWGMQAPLAARSTVLTPGGLTRTQLRSSRATLANPANPLSLTSLLDSVSLNGNATVTTYAAAQRRFTSISPEGRQSFARVDDLGRVLSSRPAGLDSITYAYDARGRLEQMASGGRVWAYSYDGRGRLLSTRDPLGRRDSLFYDDADRLTRQVRPDGRAILFAYDSSGNLTGITPPSRPQHHFDYSAVDLDSIYGPPSLGGGNWATTYRYNLDRQLTGIGRPDGGEITFGYDGAGRPDAVTFDRGTMSLTYSPSTGHLTGITAPGGNTLAFTNDGPLPRTVTWGGTVTGSVGVTYNTDFRVATQTVNGANSLSFGYDRDGLLKTAGALGIKRHPAHGLPERDSVGVVKSTWGFDTRGSLGSYSAAAGGSPLYQVSYVRDSLLRITELTETVQGATTVLAFQYDSVGRLAEVQRDGSVAATYEYDANGNRERLTTSGGVVTGTYDAQDRLTAYGDATYGYTRAGELTYRAVGNDTTHYSYDYLGNLVSVTLPNGTAISYVIDGQNRRVGKRVNGTLVQGFLYQNQLKPVAELNGSNQVVSRFVYGTKGTVPDYMVKGGVTYRLISDHLGSVRLAVNTSNGSVVQRIDYDEFGRLTQNSNPGFQPFGFAGGLTDDHTGLVRFGARDYDASTGRWTAKDPLGFGGGYSNLYEYVDNDPVNSIDPNGQQALPGAIVGGGIDLLLQLLQNGGRLRCVDWGQVGTAALLGALTSGLTPTGFLLGRGGARAAQYGYDAEAGLLNSGYIRFGWTRAQSGPFDVLGLRVGNNHLWDVPGVRLPSGANRLRDGVASGIAGGILNQATSESSCEC